MVKINTETVEVVVEVAVKTQIPKCVERAVKIAVLKGVEVAV